MATTDTHLFIICFSFLFILGTVLPFIQASFNTAVVDNPADTFQSNLDNQIKDASVVTFTDVIVSVVSIYFWTFGALPIFIDVLLTIVRVGIAWLFIRILRGN